MKLLVALKSPAGKFYLPGEPLTIHSDGLQTPKPDHRAFMKPARSICRDSNSRECCSMATEQTCKQRIFTWFANIRWLKPRFA
jgi:hypothetical protein